MPKATDELSIASYDYLNHMPKEAWVWEYLRRNSSYIEAWERYNSSLIGDYSNTKIIRKKEMEAAAKFGLLFFR